MTERYYGHRNRLNELTTDTAVNTPHPKLISNITIENSSITAFDRYYQPAQNEFQRSFVVLPIHPNLTPRIRTKMKIFKIMYLYFR